MISRACGNPENNCFHTSYPPNCAADLASSMVDPVVSRYVNSRPTYLVFSSLLKASLSN